MSVPSHDDPDPTAAEPWIQSLTSRQPSSILEIVVLAHRLSAVLLCLGLVAGNIAVCAGWLPTPEARMACCTDGECPMHKGDSATSSSHHVITQVQADACCASSERQQSSQSTPSFISVISSAVLGSGVVVPVPVPALVTSDRWRTVSPVPIAPVPRHVLLSVFLV